MTNLPSTVRVRLAAAALLAGVAGAILVAAYLVRPGGEPHPPRGAETDTPPHDPTVLANTPRLKVWWDLPRHLRRPDGGTGERSNLRPADYAGPDACRECHPGNHDAWSRHPHRWMNAPARPDTVRGDFAGGEAVSYRGGQVAFARTPGGYEMVLTRDATRRVYRVTQTIGSRFFQYYVGRQTEGPEAPGHHFYHRDYVLPFGYWLDERAWVPTVHIGPERPDLLRPDPFDPPDRGPHYAEYAASCNYCHTTFAFGDLISRRPHQVGAHAPAALDWAVHDYLRAARPGEVAAAARARASGGTENPMAAWDAEHYAVGYGVSCEACHLGARAHAESRGAVRPSFFPAGPGLAATAPAPDTGRTAENVNWACGRCHTGSRPAFAAGMSTWNSVEYSDAARGGCYPRLRCTDCHSPHEALGREWVRAPAQDDAVCLKCHDRYRGADARAGHTRHPPGTPGDRCLNCHMPRINEGIQDVVRTHMIYSPTRADMIEANHPNACNLCHPDRSIDWTLTHLKGWYGRSYDGAKLAASYADRTSPVAAGWLASGNEAVRLVAADALARSGDVRHAPAVAAAMDDPYLVNRQFAARGLERLTGVRPAELGYRFYMTQTERGGPLAAVRAAVARHSGRPR